MVMDFDTMDDHTISKDLTHDYLYDLINMLADIDDREWWQIIHDPTTIKHTKSFDSSGVTLTEDDFIGFNKNNFTFEKSSENMRGYMAVIGSNEVVAEESISPDIWNDLTEVVRNSDIDSPAKANDYITNQAHRFEDKQISFVGTMNNSRTDKDYTDLDIGKTVTLNLKSGVMALYDGDTNPELFIEKMIVKQGEETGKKEHITLILRLREDI
jgi:hypothetical protein